MDLHFWDQSDASSMNGSIVRKTGSTFPHDAPERISRPPSTNCPAGPPNGRGRVRMDPLKIASDCPEVGNNLTAVGQHGHLVLPGEGAHVLVGEATRHRLELELFVPENEADPPALGAKAPVVLGACEF